MKTALEIEREQQQRFKAQLKERERQRFETPGKDYDLESVWVVHLWVPNGTDPTIGEWIFAGFRRRRRYRRKPQSMNRFFSKVRRQLGIAKTAPTMVMDLNEAMRRAKTHDESWRTQPPQFQVRRVKPVPRAFQARWTTTKYKQRARVKAFKLDRKETRFVALGRNPWNRVPGYLYCGPLSSVTRSEAVREAQKQFPIYTDLLVLPTSALSKPLRTAMHRGRKIRAGVSRIVWPEIPPTFSVIWEKARHKLMIDADVEPSYMLYVWTEWMLHGYPWLTLGWIRKQLRHLTIPYTGDTPICPTRKHPAKIRAARAVTVRRKSVRKHGKKRGSKTHTRSRSIGRKVA